MDIRVARKEDLGSILELYRELNPGDVPLPLEEAEEIWKTIEKDGSTRYIVAVEDGRVLSTCFLSIIPNLTRGGRPIGFIENVITDGAHRKRGIGRAVMDFAVNLAKRANCYKVLLQSGMKRKEAHAFYASIGFDGESKKAFELRF